MENSPTCFRPDRSETSLWSPTFSDPFWPTSDPSIATHSTRTRNLEPQAQTQAKGSAPLTTTNLETPQNHVSCSMWSTCPRSFSPQTRFFGPGGCKMFAHFDYSNKKGKIRQKYNQLWYKEARPQPRTVLLQDVPFVTTGRCRSADLAVAGVVAEQGPCKPTPTEATKPKRRSCCPLAFRSW